MKDWLKWNKSDIEGLICWISWVGIGFMMFVVAG